MTPSFYKVKRGFTLVELLTAVSIVAILAVAVVPGMIDLVKDSRLSSQTDTLVSALNEARLEAIKQRTDIKFCPATSNANSDTTCGQATDWGKGWLALKGTSVIQRYDTKTGLNITGKTSDAAATAITSVTFNGTLGNATTAATFTLCLTGRKAQSVSVTASGHVIKGITTTTCS